MLRHQARREQQHAMSLWSLTPFTGARYVAVHLRCAYGEDSKSLSFCLAYVADVPEVERKRVKVGGKEVSASGFHACRAGMMGGWQVEW
jgi:hypothetical protein